MGTYGDLVIPHFRKPPYEIVSIQAFKCLRLIFEGNLHKTSLYFLGNKDIYYSSDYTWNLWLGKIFAERWFQENFNRNSPKLPKPRCGFNIWAPPAPHVPTTPDADPFWLHLFAGIVYQFASSSARSSGLTIGFMIETRFLLPSFM